MFEITAAVRDAIVAHALRARPEEACGMLTTPSGESLADRFHPLRNDAVSTTRFRLDPAEMLDLERASEAAERDIVGIVHSHVTTSPWPSPTDVADSANYDPDGFFHQVIVSLRLDAPSIRSFRIARGEVSEERLVVVDLDTAPDDEIGVAAAVMRLPKRPPPR